MQINDEKFWTQGTQILAQTIEILAQEIHVNCEKIEMSAGDDVTCYIQAIHDTLDLINKLKDKLYYFSDVATVEHEK